MPADPPFRARSLAGLSKVGVLAAVYFLTARLGLSLGIVEQVTAVWPPTGIALTAVPGFLIITQYLGLVGAVIGQTLCSIFLGTAYSVGAVLAMTLFPTGIRFTAFAVPAAIATSLFGSTAPFVTTWLTTVTNSPLAPGFYVLAAAAVGTVAVVAGLRDDTVRGGFQS